MIKKSLPIALTAISTLLGSLGYSQQADQQFTTLFTTPAEREYLDFLRQDFLRLNPEDDFNINEEVPPVPVIVDESDNSGPAITQYQLSGIFLQRNGTRVVWLNGASYEENQLPANMRLQVGSQPILLISTENGRYELKAGQTLNVETGEIVENWRNMPATEAEAENLLGELSAGDMDTVSVEDTAVVSLPGADTTNPAAEFESNSVPEDLSLLDDIQTLMNLTNTSSIEELRDLLEAQGATSDVQAAQ